MPYCRQCGAENAVDAGYCGACGAPLTAMHPPPAVTAQPPQAFPSIASPIPPAPGVPAAPPAPGKPRRGCRTGCLVALVGSLLACGVVAAVLFGVPAKLGLVKSPAERVLGGEPSFAAGSALASDIASGAAGLDVYVIPIEGTEGTLAYVVLDESAGYASTDSDPVLGEMVRIAGSNAARDAGVRRVAVEYIDAEGDTLMVMTAPVDALAEYASGSIDRDGLLERMDAKGDVPGAIAAQMETLRELGVAQ